MAESAFSERIVQNLLDIDSYKPTMIQVVLHNYPNIRVEWEFRCRSREDLCLYLLAIRRQLEYLAGLAISNRQPTFLERIPFLAPDFIRFLGLLRFNPRYVQTGIGGNKLFLRLKGPQLHVILLEAPLLAMISEVCNRARYPAATVEQARERLQEKSNWLRREASAEELTDFKMADFGTRHRFSYRVHEAVVSGLKEDFPGYFVGTSNVYLTRKLDLKSLDIMVYEWLVAYQQLGSRLIDSQSATLDCWVRKYRGLLDIALTDCITTDAFLYDFDPYFTKLFDGFHRDSDDPLLWVEKTIAHYLRLGIDPLTKALVFSGGLDLPRALKIYRTLQGRISVSSGTDMHFTCDLPDVEPTDTVVEMSVCNGYPVTKISDTPGRAQCRDPGLIHYLKHVFQVTQGKPGAP